MIEGAFVAYEYNFTLGGKIFSGMCAEVTKETKFDGLGDSKEDKMSALGIIVACAIGYKFVPDDKGKPRYYVSFDRGESWQYQSDKFRMDGDRVVMLSQFGQERPVEETGLMTLNGDFLTVKSSKNGEEATMIFKKTV